MPCTTPRNQAPKGRLPWPVASRRLGDPVAVCGDLLRPYWFGLAERREVAGINRDRSSPRDEGGELPFLCRADEPIVGGDDDHGWQRYALAIHSVERNRPMASRAPWMASSSWRVSASRSWFAHRRHLQQTADDLLADMRRAANRPGRSPHLVHRPQQLLIDVRRREVRGGGTEYESVNEVSVAAPISTGRRVPPSSSRRRLPAAPRERPAACRRRRRSPPGLNVPSPWMPEAVTTVIEVDDAVSALRARRSWPTSSATPSPSRRGAAPRSGEIVTMPPVTGERLSTLRDIDQPPTGAVAAEQPRRHDGREVDVVPFHRSAADMRLPMIASPPAGPAACAMSHVRGTR